MKEISLSKQLLLIICSIFIIVFILLGIFLPKVLLPIYEKNIYKILKTPLGVIDYDFDSVISKNDIAFLYLNENKQIIISKNFNKVINLEPQEIMDNIDNNSYGKFKYMGKYYYYYTSKTTDGFLLSLTDDSYLNQIRKDIWLTIVPIIIITFLVITILITIWSQKIISKIKYLKEKVDNLDNNNYIDKKSIKINDEFKILSSAIDDMRITLKKQEEYKNQMYQNISHDFKTPIAVIKSYIEAYEDGVETGEEAHKIIKEEIDKLDNKVKSLLYLNKLEYIRENENYINEDTDISIILNDIIKKLKVQKPNIKYQIYLKGKPYFNGSTNMWEAVLENILNNFIRYAESVIKITIKDNQIILFNDGPTIDENILNDIFTPYKKGINGQFGLGLSIVKKTLMLCGYEISVKNEKKGISFIIRR